jgi:hypothetical protein
MGDRTVKVRRVFFIGGAVTHLGNALKLGVYLKEVVYEVLLAFYLLLALHRPL